MTLGILTLSEVMKAIDSFSQRCGRVCVKNVPQPQAGCGALVLAAAG
jgi:hypothetical protein